MISPGAAGKAVTHFQERLLKWDPECLPDGAHGTFDNDTATAVTRFQEDHGLSATGEIDGVTAALLGAQLPG